MKTTVIILTYNERENVQELVPLILAVSSDIQIIIVDDNSPDGTSDVVSKMREIGSRIFLIKRSGKLGCASAVKAVSLLSWYFLLFRISLLYLGLRAILLYIDFCLFGMFWPVPLDVR